MEEQENSTRAFVSVTFQSDPMLARNSTEMDPKLEKTPLLEGGVRVYPMRWVILFLFSLVSITNAAIWISLSAITDIVEKYYNIGALLVDWLSLSFLIVPALTAIPGTFALARLGLKLSLVLPAAFHAIGAAVRVGGIERDQFIYVAVGQFIAALGTISILATPPRLAAVWFSDSERTTATAIGVQMNVCGISVGFLLSTLMVPDSENMAEVRNGMQKLLLTHAIFCCLLFFAVVILVRDAPPLPPSWSEASRADNQNSADVSYFQGIFHLMKSLDYNLITLAYAINFGIVYSLPTLLNQMMMVESSYQHEHISEMSVGWVGFAGPLGGIAGSLIAGKLVDKYKKYKLTTCSVLLLSTLLVVAYGQTLFHSTNVYLIAFVFTTLCFFNFPYLGYGLDHIAEISYPISEGVASAVPMILGNTSGFVLIYIFQIVIDAGHLNAVLYCYIGFQGLTLLLSLIAKTDMKRYSADHASH